MPLYNQVLSALRKNDLVRLCGEFRLSTDGPVVILHNRLKDYLNLHRDTLYRNPRYKSLFPKHRKPLRKRQLPDAPSTPPSSPNVSHPSHSRSSSESYDSWHGIGGSTHSHDGDDLYNNPLLLPPQSPHRIPNPHLQQILQQPPKSQPFPDDPYANYLPPPSNDIANSQRGSIPLMSRPVDGCKYFSLLFFWCYFSHPISSFSFLSDTMKSSYYHSIVALCSPPFSDTMKSFKTLCSLPGHYEVLLSDTMQSMRAIEHHYITHSLCILIRCSFLGHSF